MELKKEFSAKGKWFLPKSEIICFGELNYTFAKGINLILYGSLYGHNTVAKAVTNHKLNQINGRLFDGRIVTLIGTFGHEMGSDYLIESKYNADFVLCDTRYQFEDGDKINSLIFSLNLFDDFFQTLYERLDYSKFDSKAKEKKIIYKKADPILFYEDGDISCLLHFGYSISSRKDDLINDSIFRHLLSFSINFKTSVTLAEGVKIAKNVKSAFNFFSSSKVYFDNFEIKEVTSNRGFKILFHQPDRHDTIPITILDLNAHYGDLGEVFDKMIAWFIKEKSFVSNGLALYNDFLMIKGQSTPQYFLNIVFALETFHTTFYDKGKFAQAEYKELKKIFSQIPLEGKAKAKFSECMSHFNKMNFKERIAEMIDKNKEILIQYIGDSDTFISLVMKHRNYLAHQHSTEKKIPDEDMAFFINNLKLIFDCFLLTHVGVPQQTLLPMVKRNLLNSYFKKRIPEYLRKKDV